MNIIDRARELLVTVMLLIGLTSCSVPAPSSAYPEITFSHLPPIRLNVAEVDIGRGQLALLGDVLERCSGLDAIACRLGFIGVRERG